MISGWLVRLLVVFALVAVLLVDTGAVVVNFFALDSKADEVAVSLATSITNDELPRNNPQALEDAAKTLAGEADARLLKVEIDEGGVVSVRLRRMADTLVLGRIAALKSWMTATADARAGSS